jgi:hypothetical protein
MPAWPCGNQCTPCTAGAGWAHVLRHACRDMLEGVSAEMRGRGWRSNDSSRWWMQLLLAVACSPNDDPVLVLETVCGEASRFRMLTLEPGEVVSSLRVLSDADAVVYEVARHSLEVPLGERPPIIGRRILATGPCGESPRTLAEGLQLVSTRIDLYGCDPDSRDLFALDLGGAAPIRIASDVACLAASTPFGVLAVERLQEEAWGRLLLIGDEVTTLLPAVRVPGEQTPPALWTDAESVVVALQADGTLVRVALESGSHETWMDDVADVRFSRDGGHVIIQRGTPLQADELVEGAVHALDRDGEHDVFLGTAWLGHSPNPFDGAYAILRLGVDGPERAFALPNFTSVPWPDHAAHRGTAPGDRLVYSRGWDPTDQRVSLWDPQREEHRQLYAGPGYPRVASSGLEVFLPVSDLQSGTLIEFPWEGGEPISLAQSIPLSRVRLPDGRVLAVASEDEQRHGPLALHEPDRAPKIIDDYAHAHGSHLNRGNPFPGDVVYTVAVGERAGVWRARVPFE